MKTNKLDKLISAGESEYLENGSKVTPEEEAEINEVLDKVKNAIESKEINNWNLGDIVDAYIKLAGGAGDKKKAASLRIKLIKTPKKLLIMMLKTAISKM